MLEYLTVMLFFMLPLILYAVYKRRFKSLGLAAIMGLAIGVCLGTPYPLVFSKRGFGMKDN
jgi:hypothetical protein